MEQEKERAQAAGTHRRRVHYQGKYPRRFEEKYKERQPEKYRAEIAHVIAKGNTPAGMHIPIMVDEILDVLAIQPGERGFDATLGYGGHTCAMLKRLAGQGHLYSGDVDPIESAKTAARIRALGYGEDLWSFRAMNFAAIDALAAEVGPFDFVLADLGVSSMQLDDPARGFTYKEDGPLDLRLNPQAGIPAAARLAEMAREEIEGMLVENADEPYAAEIAREIAAVRRRGGHLETTRALHEAVVRALRTRVHFPKGTTPEEQRLAEKKSSARVFQALRIDVNREYEVLYEFMEKLPDALAPGGRAAILTFHSGEDRIVKKALQAFHRAGVYRAIAPKVLRPSREECYRNSRAHSTKLRWAVKA